MSKDTEEEKDTALYNKANLDALKGTLKGYETSAANLEEARKILERLSAKPTTPATPKKTPAQTEPQDVPRPSYPPNPGSIGNPEQKPWDSRDRIFQEVLPKIQSDFFDKPQLGHQNTTPLTDPDGRLSGQVGGDIGTQEGRTAELKPFSPRTDSPETPDFAGKNLSYERTFLKGLRESQNPDHQYLTSPTVKPADYVPKYGDSPYTSAIELAKEEKRRTGDGTKLAAVSEAARKAGAPLYPRGVQYMSELGNAYNNPDGKRGEDGNMYFNGQYLGKIMYDKNHAQNNPEGSGKMGTSGSTMIQLDQGLTVWGKEIVPKGYMMRMGTGMIYDANGNYAGNFETNGSFFNRAMRVHINPKLIQYGLENRSQNMTP